MKKILFILLAISLGLSCKKDNLVPKKAFEDISFQDIQALASKMTYQELEVSGSHQVLKPGSVILFSNFYTAYGKMKFIEITPSNALKFDLVVYNDDGSIKWNESGLLIDDTCLFDFGTGSVVQGTSSADFQWTGDGNNNMLIIPYPKTHLYLYSKQ